MTHSIVKILWPGAVNPWRVVVPSVNLQLALLIHKSCISSDFWIQRFIYQGLQHCSSLKENLHCCAVSANDSHICGALLGKQPHQAVSQDFQYGRLLVCKTDFCSLTMSHGNKNFGNTKATGSRAIKRDLSVLFWYFLDIEKFYNKEHHLLIQIQMVCFHGSQGTL